MLENIADIFLSIIAMAIIVLFVLFIIFLYSIVIKHIRKNTKG